MKNAGSRLYVLRNKLTRRLFEDLPEGRYLIGRALEADLIVDDPDLPDGLLGQLDIGAKGAFVTELGEAKLSVGGVDPGFRVALENGRPVTLGGVELLWLVDPPRPESEAAPVTEGLPTAGAADIVPASKDLALKIWKKRRWQIVKAAPGLKFGRLTDNHFFWDETFVSRHHAEIEDTPRGLAFRDLGSIHGSWINKVELRGAEAVLRAGQVILLGDLPNAPRIEVLSAADTREGRLREDPRHALVGEAPAFVGALELAEKYARGRLALLYAEPGCGKEGFARHIASLARPGKPFVAIDCGALSPTLLHAELFGALKGAWTDGKLERTGLFRSAQGGVVFLDEIGEVPYELQAPLLHVLQEGEVRPLGADQYEKVDVFVVAATNKDLEELVKQGKFRKDLFDRLGRALVEPPPLRERKDDIPALASFHLAERACLAYRPALSEAALGVLAAHDWPGNVRELCNVVEVAALRTERGEITAETVKQVLQGPEYRRSRKVRLARVEAEALEKQLCLEAREKTGLPWYKLWEPLGYESESQLYRRLKKWEIT